MCGKNNLLRNDVQEAVGSPPRMREELKFTYVAMEQHGITPAHAGRMREPATSGNDYQDHPRACGKNHIMIEEMESQPASPPRMREESGIL